MDILINSAGVANDAKHEPGKDYLRDLMCEAYNVNVFGAMQTFETFAPLLEKSEHPRVVFMSGNLGSFTVQAGMGSCLSEYQIGAKYVGHVVCALV